MHTKNTILVVDDEEMIKRKLVDVIAGEYDVMEASNGKEALELFFVNSKDKIFAEVDCGL